ncbi:MAG: ferrous iron transport protein B [Ureaplasma sp.]|nr:ferrous iron transport protein B [Ureaplasma sp.]
MKLIKNKQNNIKQFLLVGNPNVGKSTYFNRLTWQNSPIGNVDRITVTATSGNLRKDKNIRIIDLPGIYTLNSSSDDEKYAINAILNFDYDAIINIASVVSLKRDLLLTTQLLESGLLTELIINMADQIDADNLNLFKLSQKLKVKVNLITASKNKGIAESIKSFLFNSKTKTIFKFDYGKQIEAIIEKIELLVPKNKFKFNSRFFAIQFLEGNNQIHTLAHEWNIYDKINSFLKSHKLVVSKTKKIIRDVREKFINETLDFSFKNEQIFNQKNNQKKKWLFKFDKLLLNKVFGSLFFIAVIALIYYLTFGEYAGGFLNEKLTNLFDLINQKIIESMLYTRPWVQNLVVDGILGGIFTMIGFIPYITIMFLCVNFIEQTGYLSRVCLLLDKQLEKFGISGRSVISLITGIGCNIPAVMMARNCHSFKERRVIFLIAPFIACSARLVVFTWLMQAFVGTQYSWLLGIAFTFFTGIITLFSGLFFSQTIFRNDKTFLLTELPNWRLPSILIILKTLGLEVWSFIKRIFIFIFVANLIMFLLMYISPTIGLIDDTTYLFTSNIDWTKASFLQYISLPFQYLYYPIGLGEDWRFATSLITAAPAKEIAATNISLMFSGSDVVDANTAIGFKNALFTSGSLVSLPIASLFSYIILFAFYIPCMSTIAIMKKEGGTKNTLLHLGYAFVLSYLLSLIGYSAIGSIEKIILFKNLVNNYLLITSWVLLSVSIFATLLYLIVRTILSKTYLKTNSIKIYKNSRQFWLVSIFIFAIGIFILTLFLFIY